MNNIWNITTIEDTHDGAIREARSPVEVARVAEQHFLDRPISVLEIGVFQAGLTRRLHDSSLNIREYDGVDPYLGTGDDPYLGAYWDGVDAAESVYQKAEGIFDSFGYRLHRSTSNEFGQTLEAERRFDLIYVDGDHRYHQALWDMCTFFHHVKDGGLLMVDDYGNVDVPDVTRAVNQFIRVCRRNFERIGYLQGQFINQGKYVPVSQFTVYVQPVGASRRKTIDIPKVHHVNRHTKTDRRAILDRLLDVSPRQVLRKLQNITNRRR